MLSQTQTMHPTQVGGINNNNNNNNTFVQRLKFRRYRGACSTAQEDEVSLNRWVFKWRLNVETLSHSLMSAGSRSTTSRQLVVPPAKLSTYGRRAFAISRPRIWNSLPDYLKDSELYTDIFKRYLKTYFFASY